MMFVLVGRLPMADALSGFATPAVWLVLAAMITARLLGQTAPARRAALHCSASASSAAVPPASSIRSSSAMSRPLPASRRYHTRRQLGDDQLWMVEDTRTLVAQWRP
jgi:hypothetical protein